MELVSGGCHGLTSSLVSPRGPLPGSLVGFSRPQPLFANRDMWDICEGGLVETSVTPLSAGADSADQTGEAGVPFLPHCPTYISPKAARYITKSKGTIFPE